MTMGRRAQICALAVLFASIQSERPRAADGGQVVYSNAFEDGSTTGWNHSRTATTPSGRNFLGEFTNEQATLTIEALPPHGSITVSFDLYVIRSWDGYDEACGCAGEEWQFDVAGIGAAVLRARFSNTGAIGNRQSYPHWSDGTRHPARTGALEQDTLGYQPWGDAVYHMQFTFPHRDDLLSLNFTGINLQNIGDESWGLDNVQVEVGNDAVVGWGDNSSGQLSSTAVDSRFPGGARSVAGLSGVIQVAAGDHHTVALKSDGSVWAWGDNAFGQLGPSALSESSGSPIPVLLPVPATAVAAGNGYSLALLSNGAIWGWGDNSTSQLGSSSGGSAPKQIDGIDGVMAVSAGPHHVLALKNDGTVWAWGGNNSGQLGPAGFGTSVSQPQQVPGITRAVAVSAGGTHSLALLADGTVRGWGDNTVGQLGPSNSGATTAAPQFMPAVGQFVAIAAGGAHSLALGSDGSVWSWGDNRFGQAGDVVPGTGIDGAAHQVAGISGVIEIAAGDVHSLALNADGRTIWAFGANDAGQIGLGGSFISDVSDVASVAAGFRHSVATVSASRFAASPLSITFDDTAYATSTDPKAVGFLAAGTVPVSIARVALESGDVSDFSIVNDGCTGTSVAPGSSCAVAVVFTPTAVGTRGAVLTVTDVNGVIRTAMVFGLGIPGTKLVVSPTTAVYGTHATVSATLTTVGGAAVPNAPVTFAFGDGALASGTTNAAGVATTPYDSSHVAAGAYPGWVRVAFAGDGNGPGSSAAGNLTIEKAPLTVRADNVTRFVGEPNPFLSVSYDGFVNGDTAVTALTGTALVSTAATSISTIGSYPLAPSIGSLDSRDYAFVFTNGTLTIVPQFDPVARQTLVYRASGAEAYDSGLGNEWAFTGWYAVRPGPHPNTDMATMSTRKLIGQFGSDTASLTLSDLPSHSSVTVSFDVLVINSWDGNGDVCCGEQWGLAVRDGQRLALTTFSNTPYAGLGTNAYLPGFGNSQTYPITNGFTPSTYLFRAYTGATASPGPGGKVCDGSSSGFGGDDRRFCFTEWSVSSAGLFSRWDSIYHLTFTFDHATDAVTLNFFAQNLQAVTDESWGLDNVRVTVGRRPRTPVITVTPSARVLGGTMQVNASISGDPGGPIPSGSIKFFDNGVELTDWIALDNNATASAVAQVRPGLHSLTAQYSGDATYVGGASQIVIPDATRPFGSVLAWGSNSKAQGGPIGAGLPDPTIPQSVHLDNAVAVAGGCCHSLALKSDGTVWGWGENTFAQLGDRSGGADSLQIPGIDDVLSLSAGSYHALALRRDGTVWGWGQNFYGEIGARTDLSASGYSAPSFPAPQQIGGIDQVVDVAAGNFFSLALKDDGSVWGWGYDDRGEIGLGNAQGSQPQQLAGLDHVVDISAGYTHAIALKSDGSVWGWGDNTLGQLAADGAGPFAPFKIADGAIAIAAGTQHNLLLKADGSVWAWGDNSYSQAGMLAGGPVPLHQVLPAGSAVAIAAGAHHSLALTAAGTVWAWGDTPVGSFAPESGLRHLVQGIAHATAIGAGRFQSLAIVAPAAVSTLQVGDASSTFGDAVPVTVTLSAAGAPLAAKEVAVTIDGGRMTTAVTDATGVATAMIPGSGLTAGSHVLRATFVGDANQSSALAEAHLTVARARPSLVWAAPAPIVYGTPLGPTQLGATANVPGTFTYAPAAGTVLHAGATQALTVTFVPADTANYESSVATKAIDVDPKPLTISMIDTIKVFGEPIPAFGAFAGGLVTGDGFSSLAGSLVFTTAATAASPVGSYSVIPGGLTSTDYSITFLAGTLRVVRAATTTSVSGSVNPAGVGQPVTFSATVTAQAPGAGVPVGTVQFADGSTAIATVPLVAGTASVTTSLAPGSHTVVVTYSGDESFTSSTGTAPATVKPATASTGTTLSATVNPVAAGSSTTLKAVVTPLAGSGVPTGSVTFVDENGATLGRAPVTVTKGTNEAALTVTFAAQGIRSIGAIYSGDASFAGSTSIPMPLTVYLVNPPAATVTVVSAPAAVAAGAPFTVTAGVSPAKGKKLVPPGAIALFIDGVRVSTAAVDATGTAAFTVPGVVAGLHSVSAQYLGDPSGAFAASVSPGAFVIAR